MPRLTLSPFALLLAALAPAAPVPKDFDSAARRVEQLFGKAASPPKAVGEFKFTAKGLTAKMPAAKFGDEYSPDQGMRTQALVVGDFEAEVAMRLPAPPGMPTNRVVCLGGGLFACDPDKKTGPFASVAQNLTAEPPQVGQPVGWMREVLAVVDANDFADTDVLPTDPSVPYRLRLTRKGDTFAIAVSPDGKKWRELKPMKFKLPATVGVGVFCYNRTGEPVEVAFEEFSLNPRK